ncbi:family 1 glycosylhydrolase [Caldimonas tepidiphila]|uniref:family 1 glycosylhydrolase n=1 Tax=Caldimonas tepidiphila TaxID=2315841 RepID=UPI000E5A50E9|nr:family 1 glycosylhydrolase [Caldimonas tepidiphila]
MSAGPELWVGIEPTVSRVGDAYMDQIELSGFAQRLDDLDRLASLGAKRMRFPLLWERTSPQPGRYDWDWADGRLARMRELGLAPIAGLLHHGSGPRHTDLLDPAFPEKLAEYAAAVARRYPWIDMWTPVNEPLTTARFAALYGVWYPHRRDDRSFVRALLNQVRGTVLAMRAIRAVNPAAQLVQTDDLGHTSSTEPLRYQAEFENERRWLSYDLLCGRVGRSHPLWKYLTSSGAGPSELDELQRAPCPPDIVGINSYLTSERFLDHRLERYPAHLHGGNGRDRYVDTEAVRVLGRHIGGFEARLREAAVRYGRPLAITEVHLGCTREEQLRWLLEGWRAAQTLRGEGVDMRAVTVWSAMGAFDWDSLLTQARGHYEPGLWDVRGPEPRPTALARVARQLGHGIRPNHPVLSVPGWWRRELRLIYPAHGEVQAREVQGGRPILITGATGTLGQAFARMCAVRGLPFRLLTRTELDIGEPASVQAVLDRWQPWAIVNTAGFVRVDDAQNDPRQWRENAEGPAVLARACAQAGVELLTFSSDLVFDGRQDRPYVESDTPRPLNAYGEAKHAAEQCVLDAMPHALVVRTSAFFGPWDRHNFVTLALEALRRGERWTAAEDQIVSPTYVPDLVGACLDLLIDGEQGLWHLANDGAVSWAGFARLAARMAGLPQELVQGVPCATLGLPAPRPAYAVLGTERGRLMPSLEHAMARYLREVDTGLGAAAPERVFGCLTRGEDVHDVRPELGPREAANPPLQPQRAQRAQGG